jgi:hypothetical protein
VLFFLLGLSLFLYLTHAFISTVWRYQHRHSTISQTVVWSSSYDPKGLRWHWRLRRSGINRFVPAFAFGCSNGMWSATMHILLMVLILALIFPIFGRVLGSLIRGILLLVLILAVLALFGISH